jgi:hypothetical protein
MSDETYPDGTGEMPGAHLGELDQNVLRTWYEGLVLVDPRYDDKRVKQMGARAMVDDEFRRQLVGDVDPGSDDPESREEVEVRFHTNTSAMINVVLPPRAGAAEAYPMRLRDALNSRTANDPGIFQDDWFDNDPDHNDHGVDGRDTWDAATTVLKFEL